MTKAISLLLVLTLVGCQSVFFKTTDGVSNSIAISVPESETTKIQVLEYLSGTKTIVRDISKIKYQLETISSNDYFGIIHVREQRKSKIEIEPLKPLKPIEQIEQIEQIEPIVQSTNDVQSVQSVQNIK